MLEAAAIPARLDAILADLLKLRAEVATSVPLAEGNGLDADDGFADADIREPLPPKAKWKHKKRYQRLRNQVQALEAEAKQTRFRKDIDVRAFAYHVR
jgi:hypothetical protein